MPLPMNWSKCTLPDKKWEKYFLKVSTSRPWFRFRGGGGFPLCKSVCYFTSNRLDIVSIFFAS
ncbi:hypothetical protein SAMN04487825_12161 [Prevotella sp. kh1p2]|nr:hypothetical protein SAMN04487825_12161 [Prevotella sp. kh1p2]SNU12285.1 hypothetical protein SAMN06298210_1223 [Prevotellaceae bacterium KH2P17]